MSRLESDGQAGFVWRSQAGGAVRAWLMQAGVFGEKRGIVESSQEATQWQVEAVGDLCAPGCDDIYWKNVDCGAARITKLDGSEFTPAVG